jgi:hypothetical protein
MAGRSCLRLISAILATYGSERWGDIHCSALCRHTLKYDEDEVHAGHSGQLRDGLGVKCDLRVTSTREGETQ